MILIHLTIALSLSFSACGFAILLGWSPPQYAVNAIAFFGAAVATAVAAHLWMRERLDNA